MAKRKRTSPAEAAPSKASQTTTRKTARMSRPATPARITRGMTTDAARKAVVNTSELLENILVHLPPRQLFTLQRVNRQFKEAIEGSIQMQEKMFLRPKEPTETSLSMGTSAYSDFIPMDSKQATGALRQPYTVATPNKTVFHSPSKFGGGTLLHPRDTMLNSIVSAVKGENFSWKNSSVCDPPCMSATLEMYIEMGSDADCQMVLNADSTSGLTVGSLMSTCRAKSVHVDSWAAGIGRRWTNGKQTLKECFDLIERETSKPLRLVSVSVLLSGFVMPTDYERRQVELRM